MSDDVPAWMKSLADAPDTLSYHLAHPEENFDTYYKRKKLERAQDVIAKKKIYLDQKYWIYCRDVEMGRSKECIHQEIYEALKSLVSKGIAICPTSHLVLEETTKQLDLNTRRSTASVIDRLSGNISLEPIPYLDSLEWFCYFQNIYAKENCIAIVAKNNFAWTWSSYMLDTRIPHSPWMGESTNTAFKKAFFDSLTHLPFSNVLDALGSDINASFLEAPDFVDDIIRKNLEFSNDAVDFSRVLRLEMMGAVKTYLEQGTIEEALRVECHHRTGRWPTNGEALETNKLLFDLAFRVSCQCAFGTEGRALPCVHIVGGIHAKVRNNDHKWKHGDAYDCLHARCALPYCDYFFTERALCNLLVQPPLRYDKAYDCKVMWKEEEILETLKDLSLKASRDIT